jgi:hypothetical protein
MVISTVKTISIGMPIMVISTVETTSKLDAHKGYFNSKNDFHLDAYNG